MQMGLNRALQALTSGSTQVGQAREEAKGAARRSRPGLFDHRGTAVASGAQGSLAAAGP